MGSAASRDLGLARIGRTTRFMAAGVVLGGAGLSAAAAKALPGHSSHPTSAQTGSAGTAPTPVTAPAPSTAGGSTAGDGSSSSGGSAPITPPTQAPQPVYTPPVVNSGGS